MKALFTLLLVTSHLFTAIGQDVSIRSTSRGQRTTLSKGGLTNFTIESRGQIEITDDDKDIKSISSDGYLEITKTVFGSRRTLIISPQGNGIKREYYEGRTSVAFEPEGRKWLGEILPELVRTTTIGASSRVNRFFRQGGSKAVVDEIRAIDSDYLKVHYANLLMELKIPFVELVSIVKGVTETMDSDHYITEFLTENMGKFIQSDAATTAVFAATGNMESDHYKTQVIKGALKSGPASVESVKIALKAARDMSSDHYKSEVLTSFLKQNDLNDPMIVEIVTTTKSMSSDHYRALVLNNVLTKTGLSTASFQRTLESVKDMDSDHYKTEVFKGLLQNELPSETHLALISAASSIDSDHYYTIVVKAILQKQPLNDETFQGLLETIITHDSDFYISQCLRAAAERPNLSRQNMESILKTAGNISSDHYITEVLISVAPMIKSSNEASLKETYRATAKKIRSETYYGRAMRAID